MDSDICLEPTEDGPQAADKAPQPGNGATVARSRKITLGLLWVTYAAHYLCRVNFAAAQKDLSASQGLGKQQLGSLLSLLKVFYASGQFINGHLADRLSPRRLIILGLTASGIINLLFAHGNSFGWFAVLWAANGYFQSFGWTSVVRLAANWFPPRLRETASGILGTSYVLGSGFSWLLAGRLTQAFGWRYAFWCPAWICFGVAAVVLCCVRDRPRQVASPASLPETPRAENCKAALPPQPLNRRLALACLALADLCLLFGYHGLLDWTPHYLAEVGRVSAGVAANRAFLLPLGGGLGCLALALISRLHPGKLGLSRTVVAPLLALAVLVVVFPILPHRAPSAVPATLLVIGAVSSPPASVMACALPADLCGAEAAGRAAGVVDASGYVGSALSGWVSGQVMERMGARRGPDAAWAFVWRMWAAGVLVAACLITLIAKWLKRDEERMRASAMAE
ncbi:MAG: MFS transporter [Armatimonadota bacterium]